jgi:ribosomal protein S2
VTNWDYLEGKLAELRNLETDEEKRAWFDSLAEQDRAELETRFEQLIDALTKAWERVRTVLAVKYYPE